MNAIVTIVLAVLLTVFLAAVAIAGDHSYAAGGQWFQSPLRGEVVSVNLSDGTLAIEPINRDVTSSEILQGKLTLSTDDMTSIKTCNNSMDLAEISVGENVNVMYHVKDGRFVAESIDIAKKC